MLLSIAAASARACGQYFPNNLLSRGDDAVLAAPVADFESELDRLHLPSSRFSYVDATNGYAEQSFDAEMADLAAALKRAKASPKESALIVEGHRGNKKKLADYRDAFSAWEAQSRTPGGDGTSNPRESQPSFPSFTEVPGLPGEFADYFTGVAALSNPAEGKEVARADWERLLDRPAAERKYKSVWAAYRLGKSWENDDDDRATEYFQMTRDLARHGFADSIGLAAASLGWEARVELGRENFKSAMELYLEQYATGDSSAVLSLGWTAGEVLAAGGEELTALAQTADTRSVITAYLICGERGGRFVTSGSASAHSTVAWLEAVEAVGVEDVGSAERLALAAYQEGEFEIAQRWVNRTRNTAVAQWLQAKLLLRSGKVSQAAVLLAKVADRLPLLPPAELTNSTEFADSLHMASDRYGWEDGAARAQVLGELGVLHLSRREFTQALDALLRADFWSDAAYVAERVLTTDELKAYVDREWPAGEAAPQTPTVEDADPEIPPPDSRREDIRYLLARRLTREMRANEARDYFPAAWQPNFDELVQALDAGWTESAPKEQRAKSLFTAAVIARTNGMELLGTELQPDWHIHGGDFEYGVTWEDRATNGLGATVNVASAEEIHRATQHGTDPAERFHYRYQAALLAWEAAKLMPDNSDETARVLYTAGSWLKQRDPKTADMFYKSLVRRCRKTTIGDQADRMRWFPVLNEDGNPLPWESRQKDIEPAEPATEPTEPPAISPE